MTSVNTKNIVWQFLIYLTRRSIQWLGTSIDRSYLFQSRGLYGRHHHSTNILFSDRDGPPTFSATMSRSYEIYFSASNFWHSWWKTRFALLLLDQCANCSIPIYQNTSPSPFLSIDETLNLLRHQIVFRQFNPAKPYTYGLLIKALNNAPFPYSL